MPQSSPSPAASPNPRSWRFLVAFTLAYAGGTMGYLPLVAFLLPIKVAAIAGEARIGLFTATALCGTLSAILANILFGWLSDRSVAAGGGRRGWMIGGVLATAAAYGLVLVARTPVALVIAVVIFQGAVNAILAPMLAVMADEVPDAQKGLVGGLMAFAYPLAAGLATVVVGLARYGEGVQLAIVALAVAICVTPLILTPAQPAPPPVGPPPPRKLTQHDLRIAWLARLLLQSAGNSLTLYLLYYFQSLEPHTPPLILAGYAGHMLTLAYVLPLPFAILMGRLSDQLGRRKPFLLGSAIVTALGLALMAVANGRTAGAAGFITYALGAEIFLALHAVFWMQLLPKMENRGRDLGLLNLANTLPALVGPVLTYAFATPGDFGGLLALLAALTLCGGLAMLAIRGRR